jgi:hypothetical protein
MTLGSNHRLWLLLPALLATGCAMCTNIDDCNYAAYGGRWERSDMANGRVGSAFAPSGGIAGEGELSELLDGEPYSPQGTVPPGTTGKSLAPGELAPREYVPPGFGQEELKPSSPRSPAGGRSAPKEKESDAQSDAAEHSVLR